MARKQSTSLPIKDMDIAYKGYLIRSAWNRADCWIEKDGFVIQHSCRDAAQAREVIDQIA